MDKDAATVTPVDTDDWCGVLLCALTAADSGTPQQNSLSSLCSSLYAESDVTDLTTFMRDVRAAGAFPREYESALSPIDARHVLSTLLSVRTFAAHVDCAFVVVFVDLLRRTFGQLVVASVWRRCAQAKPAASNSENDGALLCTAVASLMSTWGVDVCARLENDIFPLLCPHDAVDAVSVPVDLDGGPDADYEAEPSTTDAPCPPSTTNMADLFASVLRLLEDIFAVTAIAEVEVAMLSLYGTMVCMQGTPDAAKEGAVQSGGESPPLNAGAALVADCTQILADVLLRVVHKGDPEPLSTILSRHWRTLLLMREGSAAEDADAERGVVPVDEKELVIWQSREEALRRCLLFPETTAPSSSSVDNATAAITGVDRMRVSGAVLLLLHVALLPPAEASPASRDVTFLFNSESLFWQTVAPLTEALQVVSVGVLHDATFFLCVLLTTLPPSSLCVRGERSLRAAATAPTQFRTQKYEVLFELVKQLVSLTSLCPNQHVRVTAQKTVEMALSRLEPPLRLRLAGSLLVLCPFPSVARFLHSYLCQEWTAYRTETAHADRAVVSLYEAKLPCMLAEAMQSHIQQLLLTHLDFLDCLIGELNFVRVMVATERREGHTSRLGFTAQGKLTFPAAEANTDGRAEAVDSWSRLLAWVKGTAVVTIRRRLLSIHAGSSASASFAPLQLSDLDRFSLSMAVEGVETFF